MIPFFRCSKILGEAGKQEIYNKFSENSRSQIVFRTDIFPKIAVGCPCSFPGNVLCTGVGWEDKGQVTLAFEDIRNVCKTSCTSCCLFSLLPWSAEMNYPSDYSCLCLQFQKTKIQRKPRKR